MLFVRQSTAVDVAVGPFLDSTDGVTPKTALTIVQADIRLKKNGGNWAQKNAAQTLTHEENGWYEVSLDTTDTGTLGVLMLAITVANALPVWHDFMVLPAAVYDAIVNGTGTGLRADVQQIATGAITATTFAAGAIDAAAIAANAIGASELAADAVAEIADAVWDEVRSGHLTSGTFGEAVDILRAVNVIYTGTAQAGSSNTITLDAGASANSNLFRGELILLVSGTGAGQCRRIDAYSGVSKVVTLEANEFWDTNPDNTTVFVLLPRHGLSYQETKDAVDNSVTKNVVDNISTAVGQLGEATITRRSFVAATSSGANVQIDASASAVSDLYVGQIIYFLAGQGAGQCRLITAYNGSNQMLTVSPTMTVFVDVTTEFIIMPSQGNVITVTGNVNGALLGTIGSLSGQAKLDVNTEVDTAIADARLDELLAADSDIDGAAPPTVGSVFHELLSKSTGSFTFDQTTDSLEAIRDKETDIETDTQDLQTRLPAALSSGRIVAEAQVVGDKSGYSIGAGGITAGSFAAGAIDNAAIAADAIGASEIAANAIGASELAQDAAQEIADEILNRDLAGGGSGNTRNVRNALRALRNKVAEAAGTATVYQEDDTTAAWTASVTRTAGANPITTVDPA